MLELDEGFAAIRLQPSIKERRKFFEKNSSDDNVLKQGTKHWEHPAYSCNSATTIKEIESRRQEEKSANVRKSCERILSPNSDNAADQKLKTSQLSIKTPTSKNITKTEGNQCTSDVVDGKEDKVRPLNSICWSSFGLSELASFLQALEYQEKQELCNIYQKYVNMHDTLQKIINSKRSTVKRLYLLENISSDLKSNAFYRLHESSIICIQKFWKQYRYKLDFKGILMEGNGNNIDHVSVAQVRRYLYLLDLRTDDFDQELEMQNLKGAITKKIRANTQLEKDIDTMDIKIGLLIRNRIDVQEVIAHSKLLTRKSLPTLEYQNDSLCTKIASPAAKIGLKALKKESREKLKSYQHLFYQLQTQPQHLAKLIHILPQINSTKFMETVLLTLYNFGANHREEYLLLQLFKTALQEEIKEKIEHPSDIINTNPLVIRMIISFYRVCGRGKNALQSILRPIILQVLEDKELLINISPVDIYKSWVNSIELDTGKPCGMPYYVTPEDALKHKFVSDVLARSMNQLKQVTTVFLNTIIKSYQKLPYGILFMAKILQQSLRNKFPSCPDKEVLKIVGNLIYYRFLNSAILAPDAFLDIFGTNQSIGDNKKLLNNDQRRNLCSISKLLQAASMKKGFGEEAPHLIELNGFIADAHNKLRVFFHDCCEKTKDPEIFFDMNTYFEQTMIAKPVIHISLQEICDTHRLLLHNKEWLVHEPAVKRKKLCNSLVQSEEDKLNELLNDLGDEPSIFSLLGSANLTTKEELNDDIDTCENLGKTELYLTLTNKFATPSADRLDMDRLFTKTKQLLCSVLPSTVYGQGATDVTNRREDVTLTGCLKTKTVKEQENVYMSLIAAKEIAEDKASKHKQLVHVNIFQDDEEALPLDDCKRQILKNLKILEAHGYVSRTDGYQAIVVSLAEDIINRKQYRSRRCLEILRLQKTLYQLEKKSEFHKEQIEYYQEYLKKCLANLENTKNKAKSKKSVMFDSSSSSTDNGTKSVSAKCERAFSKNVSNIHYPNDDKSPQRFPAIKLHEKGILIEIDGLPLNQFRNIYFEILQASDYYNKIERISRKSNTDGIFVIHCKYMGVRLDPVEIDVQELLQLQYEGVGIMKLFDRAKFNVNLLLHFLNAKFYGRKYK